TVVEVQVRAADGGALDPQQQAVRGWHPGVGHLLDGDVTDPPEHHGAHGPGPYRWAVMASVPGPPSSLCQPSTSAVGRQHTLPDRRLAEPLGSGGVGSAGDE